MPLVTAAAVYRTIRASEGKVGHEVEGTTWCLVAICMGIWLAGKISVLAFFARFGIIPYPSFAEISYLVGYILLTIGALLTIKRVETTLPAGHVMTFTIVILLMSVAVTNFVITKAITTAVSLPEKVFHIGLPIADMMLVIVIFSIYFVYFGAGDKREPLLEESWSVVMLGMSFSALADLITTYNKLNLVRSIYLVLLPGVLYIWSRGVLGIDAKARES